VICLRPTPRDGALPRSGRALGILPAAGRTRSSGDPRHPRARRTAHGDRRGQTDPGRQATRPHDRDVHRPLASIGATLVLNQPPELPPRDEAIDPLHGLSLDDVTIIDRVELRMRQPPGWLRGEPTREPTGELWARLTGDPRARPAHTRAHMRRAPTRRTRARRTWIHTLEQTIHLRAHPAAGWLACRNLTRHVIDGLHEEDVEIWDSRGHLVAQSRQLATLPNRE